MDDGRVAIELEPTELLRRLATLVRPPRAHLVRFHGVFGPAAKWRREMVPSPAHEPLATPRSCPEEQPPANKTPRRPDAQIVWAELLRRVFRIDVLACPCGGRRKVLALITDKKVVRSILEAMGLPTTKPPISPAPADTSPAWIFGRMMCPRCSSRCAEALGLAASRS